MVLSGRLRQLLPVLLALGALPSPAGAAATGAGVEAVHVRIAVPPEGRPAVVHTSYRVRAGDASHLSLSWIRFDGVRPQDLVATSEAFGRLEVERAEETEDRETLIVGIPAHPGGEPLEILVSYTVADGTHWSADRSRVSIAAPLPTPLQAPLDGGLEVFTVEIEAPGPFRVFSSFPTGLSRSEETGVYTTALPATPSIVRFTASKGPRRLTLERASDLVAIGLLVALGFLGWRKLRSLTA